MKLDKPIAESTLPHSQDNQEISDRRMADPHRKSALRLADLIDFLPDATLAIDRDRKVIVWNRAIEAMTGIKAEDMIGKGNYEYTIPFYGERRPQLMDLIWEDSQRITEKYSHIKREGNSLTAEVFCGALYGGQGAFVFAKVSPLYDQKGNIVGAIESIRDISDLKRAEEMLSKANAELERRVAERTVELSLTNAALTAEVAERKQAEEALKEKEERYRSLFESANDGIFILDSKGFIDCNQKGADMYGLPKEELIGRSPIALSPETQPNGLSSSVMGGEMTEAAMKGVPQTFEWQSMRTDGSLIDVEINLSRFELGSEICLQAIVRDITERKKLEQEILKTQKLESIGTLAGGIAHDFNNLLQGVFGYISIAKLAIDRKEKSLAMLEEAEKALHQSVNLTTQLLTFSKGGKPVKKLINLAPAVESAVKFALSGSQTGYRIEGVAGLWSVEADEGQLAQVIQNIVINANEAMTGRGTVTIALENADIPQDTILELPEGGRFVRISIIDTGRGIPQQNLSKIFDPYFTTKQRGSGLGLATSYSIIRNHGGIIQVMSRLSEGSRFTIYLPAADKAQMEEAASAPQAGIAVTKGRVLFMDDEQIMRNVATEMLKTLGHEVETAADGNAALELFVRAKDEERPFDIVILDLTVKGGMGGEETLVQLREIDPGVAAVVSSGYSDSAVSAAYREKGFSAILNKPYKIDDLRDCLNTLLKRTKHS